ncbi:MAG: hypothetical protein KC425_21710 [Anaerolineales bacterium]|nr:hypothetical protein [Anaerolineales bacterium]
MQESAQDLIRTLPDTHLAHFAGALRAWLVADLNTAAQPAPDFTESRAKALLRAANVTDDPTLHSFGRLVASPTAVRLALHDLLDDAGLAAEPDVRGAAAAAAQHPPDADEALTAVPWLSLTLAAYAWKSEYPLHQLDPAAPPGEYSPAGQLVRRAAASLRQQVQRSATDRDKLARQLAYAPAAGPGTPSLESLPTDGPIPPLPPHFRPPIPVRYPEVARDTLQVEPEEPPASPPAPRSEPLTITPDDLPGESGRSVQRMPPIRITPEQVPPRAPQPQPRPRSTVVTPRPNTAASTNFSDNVRQMFGRNREPMKSTRLRVVVTHTPDGPGLYGLQVKVTCKGVRSYVAGTTNDSGHFLCELPVQLNAGLTYDVDVTWPRDMGGETERKSITLHADRTEFTLPFYRSLKGDAA